MEEIKIGEYVRLDDGIIGKVIPYDNGIKIKITEVDTWKPTIESIKKHSFNIIDLIEVGDYVNGHLVVDIYTDLEDFGDGCTGIEVESDLQAHKLLTKKHIKSIATKEEFINIEYKVEE